MANATLTFSVTLSYGTFTVTGTIDGGSPGCYSGPPENCYEAEPPMFEAESVLRADGTAMPVDAYYDAMTGADAEVEYQAALKAAESLADPREGAYDPEEDWTPEARAEYEAWLDARNSDMPEPTEADFIASDLAYDAARERASFRR